mgnify:CR=1 FL=1
MLAGAAAERERAADQVWLQTSMKETVMAKTSDDGAEAEQPINYYWKSIDWDAFMRDYPPPPHYAATTGKLSNDALRDLQNNRFMARVAEAWEIPFYRNRWSAVGLEPDDVKSLDDIEKIPTFTSDDLKQAIADHPPFGDHHPIDRGDFGRLRHVGAVVETFDAEILFEAGALLLDRRRIAETVDHDIGAFGGQRAGDGQTDAGGRTGDDGVAGFQRHGRSPDAGREAVSPAL